MRWQSFFLPCLLLGNWYTKWKCSWNTRTHDEIKPKQNKTRDINFDYFIGIIERVNRSIPSILMRFDLICLCGGKTCLNDLNVIGEVHCTYFLFPSKWAHAYNTHYTCSLTAFYSPIFRIAQIFITHLKNSEKLPKWTVHSPSLHLSITKWHCNPTHDNDAKIIIRKLCITYLFILTGLKSLPLERKRLQLLLLLSCTLSMMSQSSSVKIDANNGTQRF